MKLLLKKRAAFFLAALSIASVAHAQFVLNGDFESWSSTSSPDDWSAITGTSFEQVTGLDGSGYAAKLIQPSTTANAGGTSFQTFTPTLNADYFVSVDFQLTNSGNPGTGGRTFNLALRNEIASNNIQSIINVILSTDGNVQMYDIGATEFMDITSVSGGTQSELVTSTSTDIYRMTIAGSLNAETPSYDLTLYNLTDDTIAAQASDITYYQSSNREINRIQISRGRSDFDYIVDNVYAIPEPQTYAVIFAAFALGLVLLRRRK